MLHIEMPIVVEGKYDLIKLANITDAVLIKTNGFNIFKNKETQAQIKRLVANKGAIILTDSDSAGNQIRNFLKTLLCGCPIYHVFVPPTKGKERRKTAPSAEGLLGVEGTPDEVLTAALKRFVCSPKAQGKNAITPAVLMQLGLAGCPGSKALRQQVLAALGLPGSISTNTLLKALNTLTTAEELGSLTTAQQKKGKEGLT